MFLKTITAPTGDVVTLEEAKAQCAVFTDADDDLIQAMIDTAVEQAEAYTQRQFLTTTYEMHMDSLPAYIEVPKPPFMSVESISYIPRYGIETDRVMLDASQYMIETASIGGIIARVPGVTLPAVEPVFGSVVIRFQAGYGVAADVPSSLKHWIKMRVANLYENRENFVVGTIVTVVKNIYDEFLLKNYRVMNV